MACRLRLRLELPGGEEACEALAGRRGLPLPGSAASVQAGGGVRLWFLAGASVRTVSDLAAEITGYLWPAGGGRCPACGLRREGKEDGRGRGGVFCRCADALQLSMDGFSLPHDANIRILAAGDRVRVVRQESPGSGPEPGDAHGVVAGKKRGAREVPSRSARRKAEKRRRRREEKTFGPGWGRDEVEEGEAAAAVTELRGGQGEAPKPAEEGCRPEDLEVGDVVVFRRLAMTAEGLGYSDLVRASVVRVEGMGCTATGLEARRRREWHEAQITLDDGNGATYAESPAELLCAEIIGKGPLLEPPPDASAPATGGGAPAPVGGAPVVPTSRGHRSAGVGAALRRARASEGWPRAEASNPRPAVPL